jgi:branched-chain amino acid aminotransferase
MALRFLRGFAGTGTPMRGSSSSHVEHYERLKKSCRILKIGLPHSVEELVELTVDLVERCAYEQDVYVRPLAYKASEVLGVRLHDLQDDLIIFVAPFGNYLDVEQGVRCMTSSWRRIDDTSIPARAKVTGLYVNSALAKTEAQEYGFDEAIMLTQDGHVSEGSGENIFIVSQGRLVTPPVSDNILWDYPCTVISWLRASRPDVVERPIDRRTLYC